MELKFMKVYVGTYQKYNNGSLKGAWLELDDYSDIDEFYEACKKLHSDEEDPEFMFQDKENVPDGMVSESHIKAVLWEINGVVPQDQQEAFYSYITNFNIDIDDVESVYEQFSDAYHGKWDDFDSFVRDFLDNSGFFYGVSDSIKRYFDFEAYGQNEMGEFDIYDNEFVFQS